MNLTISIAMTVHDLTHASDTLLAMAAALPAGDIETVKPIVLDNSKDGSTVVEMSTEVELDKAGFPWDERIHGASKKKTTKDSRWTKIKNLDKNFPGLFDTVIAELITVGYGTPSTETTTTTSTDNVTDIKPDTAPPPPENAAPVEAKHMYNNVVYTVTQLKEAGHTDVMIATYPLAPSETVETTVTVDVTFPELMALIVPALNNQTITQEQVNAALSPHGLTSLPLLSAQPHLVPAVKIALFG